ncbi:MAG TPA: hypothetical protein VE569_03315 [Acidimicrobiia bacterium]|nr:hypothetical protein [Acidimicrobiia bacterium]
MKVFTDGALSPGQFRTVSLRHSDDRRSITRIRRGIPSKVDVGPRHGLDDKGVISCDNVITVGQADLDPQPVGRLDMGTRAILDRALRYSLDIIY